MQTDTLFYIIIAGITALLLALFQYIYKSKRTQLNTVFAFLRFITLFSILLLIINPKFEKETYFNEKPTLIVAIDNSESIQHLNQVDKTNELVNSLKSHSALNEKFDVSFFSFGNTFKSLDSLNFNETQTNLANVFNDLSQIYKNTSAPTVLISDGNQTYGNDYEFTSKKFKQVIFPIVLGDTITHSDLKIEQLNVNRYAYLKNQFPIEVIAVYNGNIPINSQLLITSGNTTLFREELRFSSLQNSQTINLTLPANSVGVGSYTATIVPLNNEKNTINNSKPFAVEVIDQKTSVAIVSTITHPDIGAIKKAIESNEQRSVSLVSPNEYINSIDDFQMAILYQPDRRFKSVYDEINKRKINHFTITGTQTDWSFINDEQSSYSQEITLQLEDYQAALNSNYNTFIVDDLDFEGFPPLQFEFGSTILNTTSDILLYKQVNGNIIEEPLLVTFEKNNWREATLFGEGIWRWRAQNYLNNNSFDKFDDFIGKIVQYLATNKQRSRLNLEYESFYNGNGDIKISAQFFNKNYEFNTKANLSITLKNTKTDSSSTVPFILKQNSYQVDLSNFTSGEYDFIVSANGGEVSQSGHLKILEYNVEQQFLNANVTKLEQIAVNSLGTSYLIENSNNLVDDLINDTRFATVQKSNKTVVPLIDFKYLLVLLALSLSMEWFLRKYNGLI